jgi:predicted phosphoribosyltransferase
MSFHNRKDAGQKLAAALSKYQNRHPVILALPRGGVPVAAEIASALGASLDLIFVRKVGVPFQPELALGAVVDGASSTVVRNDAVIRMAGVNEDEFKALCDQELAEIERRRKRYLDHREPIDIEGKPAIVVDDGVATGATTRAALLATRARKPSHLALAVPVAPVDVLPDLQRDVDELICLESHDDFGAIGFYYSDFRQVSDEEVIETLARFPIPAH